MQKIIPQIDENGIEYWQCPSCKQYLPNTEFYKDSRRPNGLKSQCKKCHTKTTIETRDPNNARRINREYMRRARKSNPEKFRMREKLAERIRPNNEKTKAREMLNHALYTGKIIKPTNCSNCGKKRKVTAHHRDYSKPFEVIWLCYECHGNK